MKAPAWSEQEDAVLRAHYPLEGVRRCMELLPGRSRSSVIRRACFIQVRRDEGALREQRLARGNAQRKPERVRLSARRELALAVTAARCSPLRGWDELCRA